jgi:hypothetical protein
MTDRDRLARRRESSAAAPSSPSWRPTMSECRHGSIVTYAISDGDERMWACADCLIRFYPACRECGDVGHRNERHVATEAEAAERARIVEEMEAEGVVEWGDDRHRARFLAIVEAER